MIICGCKRGFEGGVMFLFFLVFLGRKLGNSDYMSNIFQELPVLTNKCFELKLN
jgi:hypothetical protein